MIPQEEIAAEVKRVLDSPYFSASPSLAKTLAFCVDTTLNDDQANLKETIIGLSCFGRDPGYDTKLDPIVRVTIRRLRKKLDSYYSNEGRNARVRIDFVKGSYVPQFELIERQTPPAEESLASLHSEARSIIEQADLAAFSETVAENDTLALLEDASFYRSFWRQNFRVWEVPAFLVLLVAAVSIGFVWYGQGQHGSRSFSWSNGSPLPSSMSSLSFEAMSSPKPQSVGLPADAQPALNSGHPVLTGGRDGSRARTPNAQNSLSTIHPATNEVELATTAGQTNNASSKDARTLKTAEADHDTAATSAIWAEPRL